MEVKNSTVHLHLHPSPNLSTIQPFNYSTIMYEKRITNNENRLSDDVDMRKYVTFPAPPTTSHEIWCYPGDAWLLACALVGKYDAKQHNTYRALWNVMQDEDRYRAILVETLDILQHSRNIRSPAGFLYSQLAAGLYSSNAPVRKA